MSVKPYLLMDQARAMLDAALAAAASENLRMSIAIVDEGGYPICLQRRDGAGLMTAKVAIAKARTAALLRAPSRVLADRVNNEPALLALTDYLPMSGGLPVVIDGTCVGAIGVSGGNAEQDEAIGTAGIAAIA